MIELRDYQLETIDNIYRSLKARHKSIIVQLPPRTGKTVVMGEIAKRTTDNGNRFLFVVHRKEIVDQVKRTFKTMGVDMNLGEIGMVQTITRHVEKLEPPDVIFVDEGHHALAKSYRRILDKFPNAIKLLFTATPWRMNGQGFDEIADDLIIGKSINWLTDNGFLAPFDYYAPNQLDTFKLKVKRNGEFDEKSIEDAMKPKIYGNAVKTFQKLAPGKQAIAYTYNVASAKRFAKELNKHGITAESVDGKTPKDKRDQIIEDYRNGKIQVVTNAELFTEGLDLPNVDCVIMLRPTKSLSLFLQFSMRALNPRKGKRAVLIDHVGNVNRFGLPNETRDWQLTGHEKQSSSKREQIKSVTVCPECFATFYRKSETCPFCGATLTQENDIETDDSVELEKVNQARVDRVKQIMESNVINNVAGKQMGDLKNMSEVKAYAKLMNYKPGWVYYYGKKRGFIH